MPSVEQILKTKAAALSRVPAKFYTGLERFQEFIFQEILALLSELEVKGGVFVRSEKNLRIASDIKEELKKVLSSKEYVKVVAEFAREFDNQKKVADQYFKEVFGKDFEKTKLDAAILKQSKQNAVELLTGATPQTEFLQSVSPVIDNAIATGASWKDTVKALRTFAEGDGVKDGKILRYAKQIASDSFAVADRSYTFSVTEELGAEWFLYFGDELPTSREFCIERMGKFYHYKEVQAWASLSWAGKMAESTNEKTIFLNCGGWNCQHSLQPVTIDMVPRDVIDRNIASGNYEPTAFDIEELDLVVNA